MVNVTKICIFAASAVLLLTSFTYSGERFQAKVSFIPGFPQNEFKANVDSIGLGGSGDFVYRLKGSLLSVGASVGMMVYGSESRKEMFSAEIPEVIVDVTTRNYILMCHLLLRLQSPKGMVRPYLDGLVGFNYLWTETGVYDRDGFDQKVASDVNFSDWTWSCGIGGGLMLSMYRKKRSGKARPFVVFLDIGACYLKGGKAEYLKEGSVIRENQRVIYDVSESSTDLFIIRAGLSFVF
ncbi:MAG: hypothetical protein OEZ52_00305 [Candidatus Aminicenantes bacterium]|nr:hypothetical protein [Candidatus Aminicenantes bacterium]